MIKRLLEKITTIASSTPNRTAIVDQGMVWTYSDFHSAIESAIKVYVGASLVPGDRVGIRLENSFDAYAYIFGALSMGLTYVPLAPSDPMTRVQTIIADSDLRLVIDVDTPALIRDLDSNRKPIRPLPTAGSHDQAVYIMHTSGTTGTPKGILISESNLSNFFEWAHTYFQVSETDVFLGHINLTFDLSAFHLFLPFLAGASVRITPPNLERIAPGEQFKNGVTIALLVPRMTDLLAAAGFLKPGNFPKLKHLLFCGEKLFAHQVEAWQVCNQNLFVHNLYGPTEATIACSCFTFRPGEKALDPVPLGQPVPGMTFSLRKAGADEVGELLISGPQVMNFGYLNSDQNVTPRSAEPYASGDLVTRDDLGNFIWLSRLDDQIKIQGHRVEVAEIEIQLRVNSYIREIVCAFEKNTETLIAFFILSDGAAEADAVREFRRICLLSLPGYMHPQQFHAVAAIPLSKNGKTDRLALLQILNKSTAPKRGILQ